MLEMAGILAIGAAPPSTTLFFRRSHSLAATAPSSLSAFLSVLSLPFSSSPTTLPSIYCGRGDRKTARANGSITLMEICGDDDWKARPKDKKKGSGPPRVPTLPAPPRKDRFDDGQIVKIEIDESLS